MMAMPLVRSVDKTGRLHGERVYRMLGDGVLWSLSAGHVSRSILTVEDDDRAVMVDRFMSALSLRERRAIRPEAARLDSTRVTRLQRGDGRVLNAASNRIVIGFVSNNTAIRELIVQRHSLQQMWYDERGVLGLFAFAGVSLNDQLDALRPEPSVLFAEPDVLDGDDDFQIQTDEEDGLPDVTFPSHLWNHDMIGVDVNGLPTDGAGVVVAVIDGRSDFSHPAIAAALLSDALNPQFEDDLPIVDHGMGVMSVVAGQSRLLSGRPIGIAPAAKLLPVAINTYSHASYAHRARAIHYAAEIAERKLVVVEATNQVISVPRLIVNCSWKLRVGEDLTALALAFSRLVVSGAICVCSAGNENTDAQHFPSEYPGIVRVAALNKFGKKLSISNFGSTITFSAPGGSEVPLDDDDILAAGINSKHRFAIGTSFAAPHVAGALAAVWSRRPKMQPSEILEFARSELAVPTAENDPELAGRLGAGVLSLEKLGTVG